MKKLVHYLKSMLNACPYTLLGKKCLNIARGRSKVRIDIDYKSLKYRQGMKTGRNIALIGVFCPFLWYAILSGKSADFIFLNAVHSSVIVVLGLAVVGYNALALFFYKKKGLN